MHLKGMFSISISACVFGLGTVLAKLLVSVLNPFLITFLALFGGGVLITGYLLARRQVLLPSLSRLAWGNLLLLAAFGTALPLLLVVAGFAKTSAVVGGVLMQVQGPAAVLFAILMLHERLNWRQLAGTGLLLLGSVLVVLQGGQALTWQGDGVGVLLIIAGGVGYGFALIPVKRLAGQATVLQLSALRLLLGACFILPLLFFQSSLIHGAVSWFIAWTLVLYIVSTYCIGYITQQAGVRFLKAWEAGAVLQTAPLFTVLFALLLLHETITLLQVLGGVIVILGGIIVARGEANLT